MTLHTEMFQTRFTNEKKGKRKGKAGRANTLQQNKGQEQEDLLR